MGHALPCLIYPMSVISNPKLTHRAHYGIHNLPMECSLPLQIWTMGQFCHSNLPNWCNVSPPIWPMGHFLHPNLPMGCSLPPPIWPMGHLYTPNLPMGCSLPRLPLLPRLELERLLALLSFLNSLVEMLPAKLLALVTAGLDGLSDPLESTLLHGRSFCQWQEEESSEVPLFCLLDACRMLFGLVGEGSTVRVSWDKTINETS